MFEGTDDCHKAFKDGTNLEIRTSRAFILTSLKQHIHFYHPVFQSGLPFLSTSSPQEGLWKFFFLVARCKYASSAAQEHFQSKSLKELSQTLCISVEDTERVSTSDWPTNPWYPVARLASEGPAYTSVFIQMAGDLQSPSSLIAFRVQFSNHAALVRKSYIFIPSSLQSRKTFMLML